MKRFAILGLGRFGMVLAEELAQAGHEVIAIDMNLDVVNRVAERVTHAVALDATDEKSLLAQGVSAVDCAVVAIGENFEANVLATINCKNFGIPQVVARGMTRNQCRILERIGADLVIQPEESSARRLSHQLVSPSILGYEELAEGVAVAQLEAPRMFHDRTVTDIDLRRTYGVTLIAIRRKGSAKGREQVLFVYPDTKILRGDILVLVGKDEDVTLIASNG